MTELEKIAQTFKNLNKNKLIVKIAIVKSIDGDVAICNFDGIDVEVRLTSVIDSNQNKMYIIPKINSSVILMKITENEYIFIAYSEIEKISSKAINIETDKIKIGNLQQQKKAVLGQPLNENLNAILTHLQTMNTLLLTFIAAQLVTFGAVPILAPMVGAYTALQTGAVAETPKITQIITQLSNHLAANVEVS